MDRPPFGIFVLCGHEQGVAKSNVFLSFLLLYSSFLAFLIIVPLAFSASSETSAPSTYFLLLLFGPLPFDFLKLTQ